MSLQTSGKPIHAAQVKIHGAGWGDTQVNTMANPEIYTLYGRPSNMGVRTSDPCIVKNLRILLTSPKLLIAYC